MCVLLLWNFLHAMGIKLYWLFKTFFLYSYECWSRLSSLKILNKDQLSYNTFHILRYIHPHVFCKIFPQLRLAMDNNHAIRNNCVFSRECNWFFFFFFGIPYNVIEYLKNITRSNCLVTDLMISINSFHWNKTYDT